PRPSGSTARSCASRPPPPSSAPRRTSSLAASCTRAGARAQPWPATRPRSPTRVAWGTARWRPTLFTPWPAPTTTAATWPVGGNRRSEAVTLLNLAVLEHYQGRQQLAGQRFDQELDVARAIDDRRLEGSIQVSLAGYLRTLGHQERAALHLEQALPIVQESGD